MSTLFTPGKIGPLTLRNRTIRSAAFEGMCPGNAPSEMLYNYHVSVAAGGIGMTTLAYSSVDQSGLSFEVGAGIGFINFPVNESKKYSYFDPYAHLNQIDSRFDLNAKVGLGFAPFVNDFIFVVHAILGGDMKYLGESYPMENFAQEYSTLLFNFVGGADIVVGYRITERLGINAGVDVTVNLFGFGMREFRFGEHDLETIDYKLHHFFSGFQVVPRVGVSLKF